MKSCVRLHGFYSHQSCGYCRENKSASFAVMSESLNAADYSAMLNLGWRRSGNFLYKPTMHITCCPQYTIRLPVSDFKISKSQKYVLRKMEKYLNSKETPKTLRIDTESATFTQEKFDLYCKYQILVHGDDKLTEESFQSFLCESPLNTEVSNAQLTSMEKDDPFPCQTYHQLYRIDNKLTESS